MRSARLTVLALLLAGPLHAQEGFDISLTVACMEDAITYEERQYCVGSAARQCMEYLGDSEGMARCAGAEAAWWETRMNATFETIFKGAEVSADQATALARMQAAWRAYRDESCDFEQAFGAGQATSKAECLLWMTGDQAVYLEDYVPGY